MTDTTTRGAHCRTAGAIVPMHDEHCDWCGLTHTPDHSWTEVGWSDDYALPNPAGTAMISRTERMRIYGSD